MSEAALPMRPLKVLTTYQQSFGADVTHAAADTDALLHAIAYFDAVHPAKVPPPSQAQVAADLGTIMTDLFHTNVGGPLNTLSVATLTVIDQVLHTEVGNLVYLTSAENPGLTYDGDIVHFNTELTGILNTNGQHWV